MSMTQKTEKFTLDRERMREILEAAYGKGYWDGLPGKISERMFDAQGAIVSPENAEVQTYQRYDRDEGRGCMLVICVRERKPVLRDRGLCEIASCSVETRHLMCPDDESFATCYETIEEVLRYATELLPSLRALQAGERAEAPAEHHMPQVTVYHGTDGAVVVEIDTLTMGEALHGPGAAPYLRVYVNECCVDNYSLAEPLPDSRKAQGEGDADPDAPIGRLIVERPNREA